MMEEEIVRRGRTILGKIITTEAGVRAYFALRKRRHVFRSQRSTISGAIMDEVAGWAIDETTLFNLRARKIALVGVQEGDTGDLFLTRMERFFDGSAKHHDYQGIGGGSRQKMLPLQFFAQRKGSVRVRKGVLKGESDQSALTDLAAFAEEIP